MVVALGLKSMDNLLWLAFRLIAFTYGPLLGIFVVTIMTDWKLSARQVLGLMITPTVITFATAMLAWYMSTHGGGPFWTQLHGTYWRLYTIFGTLFVPVGAWLLNEPAQPPHPAFS